MTRNDKSATRERMRKDMVYALNGENDKLSGWKLCFVERINDGKLIVYDYCPIFNSGVSRARLINGKEIEKTVYNTDPEENILGASSFALKEALIKSS